MSMFALAGVAGTAASFFFNNVVGLGSAKDSTKTADALAQKADLAAGQSATDKFLEYARKPTAEKMTDMIMREMGISKEELDGMTPEKRNQVMEEIARRLKEKMEEQAKGKDPKGLLVDMVA